MFYTPGTSFTPRCTACETMRVPIVTDTRPEPGIDDVNMLMLAQLFLDFRPLEQNRLSFAPSLFVLGELDALHHQFGVTFFDRFDFH